MKRVILYILFSITAYSLPAQEFTQMQMFDTTHLVISKYIYGHFAEDFGRCIYDGFWVDSNINISKNDHIRLDVVDAPYNVSLLCVRNESWGSGGKSEE